MVKFPLLQTMFNIMPRTIYVRKRDPISFAQEVGWTPGAAWWVRNISPPRGFDPLNVQLVTTCYTDYVFPVKIRSFDNGNEGQKF
jgi:hypothetical protein